MEEALTSEEPELRQAKIHVAQPMDIQLEPAAVICKPPGHNETSRKQGRLVGRQKELSLLAGCYKQILQENRKQKILVITGPSGCGKTALLEQLKAMVLRDQGIFRVGKFDILEIATPCQATTQTIADTAHEMAQSEVGPNYMEKLHKASEAATKGSEDHQVLASSVHVLAALLGHKDSVTDVEKQQMSRTYGFGILFKAFATLGIPMVVGGENEHWADKDTVERLSFLYESSELKNCLQVVTSLEPIPKLFENHRDAILHIPLSDISLEDTRELVNDMGVAVDDCVTELVFELTKGNPAFVHQTMYLLQEYSVLQDLEGAKLCLKDCTVVGDVVRRRFHKLDDQVQLVPRYAALFGTPIDTALLRTIISTVPVESALRIGKEKHFLAETGPRRTLVFKNDCVQDAIIGTMEKSEQSQIHYSIGKTLLRELSEEEIYDRIFQILDQLRRTEEFIAGHSERKTVAALCLTASERAAEASSFFVALTYLQFGIRLIQHGNERSAWREDYDLNLALHNASCELMYCLGDLDQAENIQETLLRYGRSFDDKIQAKMMKVYTLSARGLMEDSAKEALDTLKSLGVSLTARPSRTQIMLDFVRLRKSLRRLSDEAILRRPMMTDARHLSTMKLFMMLMTSSYFLDSLLAAQVIVRTMQFTLDNGLCAASSVAFAAYAVFMSNTIAYTDEGIRFGKFALKFLDKHDCVAYAARVYEMLYGHVFSWRQPYSELVEPLKLGYRHGLETGDVEYAAAGMAMCIFHQFQTDVSLGLLNDQLDKCIALLRSRSQDALLSVILPFHRLVENLINGYDSMTVDELSAHFDHGEKTGRRSLSHWRHHNSAIPAYVYGDYRIAEAETNSARKTPTSSLIGPDQCFIFMLHALVQLAMVADNRKSRLRRRRLSQARRDLKMIRKVARRCPVNTLSRLLLVEADYLAATCGDHQRVEAAFMKASGVAHESKFLMGSSFCHERWGRYLLQHGDDVGALSHLNKSVEHYRTWGAEGKVRQLSEEFARLHLPNSRPTDKK